MPATRHALGGSRLGKQAGQRPSASVELELKAAGLPSLCAISLDPTTAAAVALGSKPTDDAENEPARHYSDRAAAGQSRDLYTYSTPPNNAGDPAVD